MIMNNMADTTTIPLSTNVYAVARPVDDDEWALIRRIRQIRREGVDCEVVLNCKEMTLKRLVGVEKLSKLAISKNSE